MKLTAVTTAKHAAVTIVRTLQSLSFADERIVVVDTASTDGTAEIAERAGARVIRLPWRGFGQQKNAALKYASGEWVLFIDADEEVTPTLAKTIIQTTNYKLQTTCSIYWLRIVTVFLGRPLRHLYGHNPRLFRKDAARWTDEPVHEQVVRTSPGQPQTTNYPPSRRTRRIGGQTVKLGDPDTGLITEPLIHHSHNTVSTYLGKMHRYTSLEASAMQRTGRHRSGRKAAPYWWLPPYLAVRQLFKLLFYRRGILDGYAGVMWCILSAYYEWELGLKYLRHSEI